MFTNNKDYDATDEVLREIQKKDYISSDEIYTDVEISEIEDPAIPDDVDISDSTESELNPNQDLNPEFEEETGSSPAVEPVPILSDEIEESEPERITPLSEQVTEGEKEYLNRSEVIKHRDDYSNNVVAIRPDTKTVSCSNETKNVKHKKARSCFTWLVPIGAFFLVSCMIITSLILRPPVSNVAKDEAELITEMTYFTGKNALFISAFNDFAYEKRQVVESYIRGMITKTEAEDELKKILIKENKIFDYFSAEIVVTRSINLKLKNQTIDLFNECKNTTSELLSYIDSAKTKSEIIEWFNKTIDNNNEILDNINEFVKNEARKLNVKVVVENNVVKIDLSWMSTS